MSVRAPIQSHLHTKALRYLLREIKSFPPRDPERPWNLKYSLEPFFWELIFSSCFINGCLLQVANAQKPVRKSNHPSYHDDHHTLPTIRESYSREAEDTADEVYHRAHLDPVIKSSSPYWNKSYKTTREVRLYISRIWTWWYLKLMISELDDILTRWYLNLMLSELDDIWTCDIWTWWNLKLMISECIDIWIWWYLNVLIFERGDIWTWRYLNSMISELHDITLPHILYYEWFRMLLNDFDEQKCIWQCTNLTHVSFHITSLHFMFISNSNWITCDFKIIHLSISPSNHVMSTRLHSSLTQPAAVLLSTATRSTCTVRVPWWRSSWPRNTSVRRRAATSSYSALKSHSFLHILLRTRSQLVQIFTRFLITSHLGFVLGYLAKSQVNPKFGLIPDPRLRKFCFWFPSWVTTYPNFGLIP